MSSVGYIGILAMAAAAMAGCAGNGAGLDSNGNPLTPGGSGTEPLAADFQSIQDNVFTPICTKCHIGAGAPQGLQLDADHSYALLVGVPSSEQSNVLRVSPGNPDDSYIIRKLQGSSGISGVQMPFGGPYLPQSTIDVIRQWITAGATNAAAAASVGATAASVNVTAKAAQRFVVAVTSPDNDSVVTMVLPSIVVAFNAEVDSNLVNGTTVTLQDAGDAPIPISTSIPAGNPSALLITPRVTLPAGTYRVTLQGSLADMNARALGADYSFTFTVDSSQ